MSEIDRIEVAITADTSNVEAGLQRVTQKATEFDSKIKTVGSSDFGDKISAEADQAVSGFKKAEDAADSLVSKLKNLDIGSGLAGVSKVTGGIADGMQKIGLAATVVGVPVGLLAKNSLSMFADLESQTQRNTALLGGAKAEYEEILALSKELGASTPFDALEIGAGIESLAAAGYSLKEIQSAMPTVAEMAIATGEDLSSMSEILIATLSSYGEGADKAAMYGDKLATVANISSAGIGDFGESMKYVGAVANAFGVDIDELGASIATLADNNLKGSLAGTGLREIITTLANPTAKVREIFESFGLTMDELNPKTNDFVDILAKMKDAGVSSEAMMAAFGDRAGPAAVILLEQIDKLKENYKTLLTESDGMLKEFSGKMRDTLGFVMDEMGGTIGNIMIEIGAGLKPIVQEMGKWLNDNQQTLIDFAKNAVEGLTPFVEKFLDLAKKIMDWFNSLPDDMQSKIGMLTGLGAAMATIGGPLLLLGSLPFRGIQNIAGALSELFIAAKLSKGIGLGGLAGEVAGLGGAAGGATPALAALFGPAGILAVGLGAGALAAYATNFGQFRDNINGVIGELGQAASNISTGDYEQAGRDCAEAFGKGLESIADVTIAAISSLPDAANALNEFKTGFDVAVSEIVEGFTSELTTGILSSVESIQWPDLSQDMQSVYKSMLGKTAYEGNMIAAIEDIKSSFANIDLTSAGVSIMGTLFSGMSGAIPGLSGTLTGILEGALKGTFGTISNSMIDNIAKEFGLSPSEVQAMLKGQGPFGIGDTLAKWHEESYKKDTSDPDRVIKKYYDELIAQGITPTAAQTEANNKYYQNRSAHSGDYLKPDDVTTGTQTGVEAAAPEIGGSVAQAIQDNAPSLRSWVEGMGKQGLSDAELEKYRASYNKEYGVTQKAAVDATEDETESKEKATKKTNDLADTFSTLEEAMKSSADAGKSSFMYGGKPYQEIWDESSQSYKFVADDQASKTERKREELAQKELEAQQKASEKAIEARSKAEETYNQKLVDLAAKRDDKLGDLDISDKKYSEKKAKILDDYSDGVAEAKRKYEEAQAKYNDAIKESGTSASTSVTEFSKNTDEASKGIISFSEPIPNASGNVMTFSDAVSVASEALSQVPGAIDKILNVESSAMDSLAERRVRETGGAASADHFKQSITEYLTEAAYQSIKTSLSQGFNPGDYPLYDSLRGDLLAQLLEYDRPVDFAQSGWARREQAREYLSSLNPGEQQRYTQIVEDLINRLDTIDFAEGVQSGKITAKAEEGEGRIARRYDIVGEYGEKIDLNNQKVQTSIPFLESLASKIQSLGLNTKQTAGVLFEYNAAMDDGVAKNGEALGYLAKWNHETGKATKYTEENVNQTTDLMNALGSLNNAQALYDEAIKENGISSEEASGIQRALAESEKLLGENGITATSDISGLPGALQALASAAQSAMSQINAAIAMANAQLTNVRKVGDWTLQTMSGLPTIAPSTQTNFKFASGGPVTENGPAYLHQGEYVLRRDEVNRPTSGANVTLNVNMSNSRFGNSEMQKDLPKRIARETRRALARSGI